MFKWLAALPWNGILKFLGGLATGASLPTMVMQVLPAVAAAIPAGSVVSTVVHTVTTVGGTIVGLAAAIESAQAVSKAATTTQGLPGVPTPNS